MIEENGSITLTLKPDSETQISYTVASAPNNAASINVVDDDAPVLKIRAGDPIIEAANVSANYVISAEESPNVSITVRYDLSESHDFIAIEGTGKTADLDFTNQVTEVSLPIAITDDDEVETNGTITVTLIADTDPITYKLAPAPANSASINVYDDESLPTIAITADNGNVFESADTAEFELTATGLTGSATLAINATPAEVGSDFLTDSTADTPANFPVEFTDPDGDGTYTGELSVPLDNDEIGDITGDITATLNTNPTTYQLGSTTTGRITVWDDDAPELKVTAGNSITEADNISANFVISAEVSPNDFVMVRYTLAESEDFIDNEGADKVAHLDFRNNSKEATLSIPIINDDEC